MALSQAAIQRKRQDWRRTIQDKKWCEQNNIQVQKSGNKEFDLLIGKSQKPVEFKFPHCGRKVFTGSSKSGSKSTNSLFASASPLTTRIVGYFRKLGFSRQLSILSWYKVNMPIKWGLTHIG